MQRFASLYESLDRTTRTGDKLAALRDYFANVPAADGAWAVRVLIGERGKRRSLSSRVLRAAVEQYTKLPTWMIDECFAQVGDFSETAALLVGTDAAADPAMPAPTLSSVMASFTDVLVRGTDQEQIDALTRAWTTMPSEHVLVLHKLLRGGLRVGVVRRLVVRALSDAFSIDAGILERRLMNGLEATASAFEALTSQPTERDEGGPYPFFLAHQIDVSVEELGDPNAWAAEWKWDGIRAQLIHRGDDVSIWSRGEEIITREFPEIAAAGRLLSRDMVLDGEVLLWREGAGPAPFHALQRRLNVRTPPQPSLFETELAAFMAYDIIELDRTDFRSKPWTERRTALEALVVSSDHLRCSALIPFDAWRDLREQRDSARSRGTEGVMLKRRSAPYGHGRTMVDGADGSLHAGWLKWKLDPYAVDAVLIHAQLGSGRRAGLFTDYTFGVWETLDDGTRRLTPFAKAYSGLTNEEIEKVDAFVRTHTIGRAGPFRNVEPIMVFEIGFEGIQPSERHRSGVAVRFPRMLRWRSDKRADEADTIDALRRLIQV